MKFTVKNILNQTPIELAMTTSASEIYKYLMSKMGPQDSMYKQPSCYSAPPIKHPPVRYQAQTFVTDPYGNVYPRFAVRPST